MNKNADENLETNVPLKVSLNTESLLDDISLRSNSDDQEYTTKK